MTYLPQLKDQLVAASAEGAPARRRRRRPLSLLIAGLLAAGLTTGALAATGVIEIGTPVKDRFGLPNSDPHRGSGVIVPGSVRLLALRVADPDGGPPWGMRVIGTTRGVGCVQVGRVVDDRLGILGRDGLAHDDGRFHELPPTAVDPWNCQALDAAGNLFVSVSGPGFLASGPATSERACLGPGSHAGPRDAIRRHCPAPDQRALTYGLLGPRAATITYGVGTRSRTVPASGPEGAYLIVATSRRDIAGVSGGSSAIVGVSAAGRRDYTLRRITYTGAPTCPDHASASRPAIVTCPLVGFARPPGSAPTPEQITTRLHVRKRRVAAYGSTRLQITVTFRAPVATSGASSFYELETDLPRTGRCRGLLAAPRRSDKDLAKGDLVRFSTAIPNRCPGITRVTVRLVTAATTGAAAPALIDPRPSTGPALGHFTVRTP
ncbi:MAG: hypothetical protein QOJ35_3277 [Solirubrobacteraceae bacterium]|nr:hypothetical protein [Solirubrobacteraceae bacterium]